MVTFIGTYNAKLDDKGRLVFPAAFKALLEPEGDLKFVVKKDIYADCLEMFTFDEWTKQSGEVKSRLNFFNQDHAKFWREYMRNSDVVEPDAKFGRISISKNLLELIGITKDVVFYGNDFKIEIWSKEKFEQTALSNDEFKSLAANLPEKR